MSASPATQHTTMAAHGIILAFLLLASTASAARCPEKCRCTEHRLDCKNQRLGQIPKDIPLEVTTVYLAGNLITTIPSGIFANLTKLKLLALNNNLLESDQIYVDSFRGLVNLKELYLSNNLLTRLRKEIFVDLVSLQWIYLGQNRFTSIPDVGCCTELTRFVIDTNKLNSAKFPAGFSNLTKLSRVVLSNNQIAELSLDDVHHLGKSNITNIKISRCGLRRVETTALTIFPRLTSLNIGYNLLNISDIRNIVNSLRGSQINSLVLAGLQVEELPNDLFANFSGLPLKTLDMSDSTFQTLQKDTFRYLGNLTTLDLSRCNLEVIEDGTFGGPGDLVLRQLKLDHTGLRTVPVGLPASLTELHLSYTNIELLNSNTFSRLNKLDALYLSFCKIHMIRNDAFSGLNSLSLLDLSYNKLGGSNLGNKALNPLIRLKTLNLSYNKMTSIPTQSKMFSGLSQLEALDLSHNNCSFLIHDVFEPLKALKSVNLSGNWLGDYFDKDGGSQLFAGQIQLEELRIESSKLRQLPAALFPGKLASLKRLLLKDNEISEIVGAALGGKPNLTYVDLSQNKIAIVNQSSVAELVPGASLDVTGNPFSCWCDLVWFRYWIDVAESRKWHISLPNNRSYECHSPSSMTGRKVVDFDPESIIDRCYPLPWQKIVIVAVFGVTALFICGATFYYKYRWAIRVRIYMMKKRLAGMRVCFTGYSNLNVNEQNESEYDACVLYGPEENDESWVEENLLPIIDSEYGQPWKVFYEKRDSMMNYCNIGEVVDAIYTSKRVILILTESYLKNSRRKYELETVFTCLTEKEIDVSNFIIAVVVEPNTDVQVPRLLHPIFRNDQELNWTASEEGKELFRRRLKDLMPAHS